MNVYYWPIQTATQTDERRDLWFETLEEFWKFVYDLEHPDPSDSGALILEISAGSEWLAPNAPYLVLSWVEVEVEE